MIQGFGAKATEDIYFGRSTKAARKTCPIELWGAARRKLDLLTAAKSLGDLRELPGNRLEKLSGDRAREWSIRINDQFRVCFRWEGADAHEVEIADYH